MNKWIWLLSAGLGVLLCFVYLTSPEEVTVPDVVSVSLVESSVKVSEGKGKRVSKPRYISLPIPSRPDKESGLHTKLEGQSAVQIIIDNELDYQVRLGGLRLLGNSISSEDLNELIDFLSTPMPDLIKLSKLEFNGIKNDLMEVLLNQQELPPGLGDMLLAEYDNPEQDSIWRNYCIQFMKPFYEKQANVLGYTYQSSDDEIPSELKVIQDALWISLVERENSNAGTALLALIQLSKEYAEIDKESVRMATIDLAKDNSATLANRVTALRLCGNEKNDSILPLARSLALDADSTMLRCAAVATLGDIGSDEDLVLLKSLVASPDERISSVARCALDNGRFN